MADFITNINDEQVYLSGYGEGCFQLSGGLIHRGSILMLPQGALPWTVDDMAGLSVDSLQPVFDYAEDIDVLILGCGEQIMIPRPSIRDALKEAGISLDLMDTSAAGRTYNVLQSEGRRAAAALIAI